MNSIVALIRFKKDEILDSLSKSVGLVVRDKKSVTVTVTVILKSPHIFNFDRISKKNSHIFIWAICGSVSDKRGFEIELQRFQSIFADTFSERDLNIRLFQDFISGYLKHKFYDRKSAEPVALELILGGIFERHMIFYTINHEGNSEPLNQKTANIDLIGGGDDKNRKELLDLLSKLGLEKLSAKEIVKKIRPHLKRYRGNFAASTFTVPDKKSKVKDTKKPKKTTKIKKS